jgi:hypothetical protein
MARQAIRELIQQLASGGGDDIYRLLVKTRDHLLHGRSPTAVEVEVGRPLEQVVNEAAAAAWNAIMFSIPKLEDPAFGHRGGDFVRRKLALLWQIYSRCLSLQIHFLQCGHRCGGSWAMSSRMAWRTAGKVG